MLRLCPFKKYSISLAVRNKQLSGRSIQRIGRFFHKKCSSEISTKCFEEKIGVKENSNVNFFGIESDKDVIVIDPHRNTEFRPIESKVQSKEKFYKANYGIIRRDSDNELKFHGQYDLKLNCELTYQSTQLSDVFPNKAPSHSINLEAAEINNESEKLCDLPNNCVYQNRKIHQENFEICYNNENFFEIEDGKSERDIGKSTDDEFSTIDYQYFGATSKYDHQSDEKVDNSKKLIQNFSDALTYERLISQNLENIREDDDDVVKNKVDDLSYIDEMMFTDIRAENFECQNTIDKNLSKDSTLGNEAISVPREKNSLSNENSVHQNLLGIKPKLKTGTEEFDTPNTKNSKAGQLSDQMFDNTYLVKKSEMRKKNSIDLQQKEMKDEKLYEISLTENKYANTKLASEQSSEETREISADKIVSKWRKKDELNASNVFGQKSNLVDSKGFRILKNQVPDFSNFTKDEIITLLRNNILYSDEDLMILNKPYNLVIHDSQTTRSLCLSQVLEDFAKLTNPEEPEPKLYTVHRLDKEATGCLLLARNEITAARLKSLFAQRKIVKKYWIVTSKVPNPLKGVIDIPIAEGSIHNKKRMVLHPKLPTDIPYKSNSKIGKRAVTAYQVICISGNAALVEVISETGLKHQIRVHFGFGLSCPILGDHKYSHLDKMAPQKLASDLLQRLHVRQAKVRHIPMHLHAHTVTIPGHLDGRDLVVSAPLPHHMVQNLRKLKFKKKNKLKL